MAEGSTRRAAQRAVQNNDANFWLEAREVAPTLSAVAAKLCSSYCGQGSSERINKITAHQRTAQQSSMVASTVAANLEINYAQRVTKQIKEPEKRPFLQMFKEDIALQRAEAQEEEEALSAARALLESPAEGEGGEDDDDDDEAEDDTMDRLLREIFEVAAPVVAAPVRGEVP
jgi:hypothetical protein